MVVNLSITRPVTNPTRVVQCSPPGPASFIRVHRSDAPPTYRHAVSNQLGSAMREEYRAELADVTQTLVAMADGVRVAMRRATAALGPADRPEAEAVVRDDGE